MMGYVRSRREKYGLCRTFAWGGIYHRDMEQIYTFHEFLIPTFGKCGKEPHVGFKCEEWGLCIRNESCFMKRRKGKR